MGVLGMVETAKLWRYAAVGLALLVSAIAQSASAQEPLLRECSGLVDKVAARKTVQERARAIASKDLAQADVANVVRSAWRDVRFEERFTKIVDEKLDELREDRAYWERLLDGYVPSRAEEMAQRTGDLVFGSLQFDELQKDLQHEVGQGLRPTFEQVDAAVLQEAESCVSGFLKAKYAPIVANGFEGRIGGLGVDNSFESGEIQVETRVAIFSIAALLALIFRRVLQRIIRAIVLRLAGAIAARFAAWATVLGGVAFLVWDLVAGADGVFPVIRAEMLSQETYQTMQTAIIEEISTGDEGEVARRADAISEQILAAWEKFETDHALVLNLAERNDRFNSFLQNRVQTDIITLSAVVAALSAQGGDAAVDEALSTGLLEQALAVPNIEEHLAQWRPRGVDLPTLVAWRDLAKDGFERVLDLEIPAVAKPSDFTRDELNTLYGLDDVQAVRRVAALPAQLRKIALGARIESVRALASKFETPALATAFSAVSAAEQPASRSLYISRLAQEAGLMTRLQRADAPTVIAASRSPEAALSLVLDDAPIWSPFALNSHVKAVADGDVSAWTLPARYGWWLTAIVGFPALIGLGLLRSVLGLFVRRR